MRPTSSSPVNGFDKKSSNISSFGLVIAAVGGHVFLLVKVRRRAS
jgi:hypothetical protein